ncbi:MAG: DNA repair protein RecN [Muribaculaceae bacterium]|nr:DNA repair protein RecN [Muribaculaceae bacterium]
MLSRLYISNYALIDHLEIDFKQGLTIITGETGAGKSILLGALALILGERADSKAMRDSSRKTVVEATCDIAGYHLEQLFADADLDYDDHECIMRREIAPNGRSRAFVNDSPVPLTVLRDVATRLVDIHSQHSNMLLAKPQFQLDIIDSLAANEQLRAEYQQQYRKYVDIERRLTQLAEQCDRARGEEDYLRFQLKQLDEMNLQPGEDAKLEAEQAKLSNVTEIKQTLWEVEHLLADENVAVIDHLKTIVSRLQALETMLPEVGGMAERVDSALIDLKDIASSISNMQEALQLDPEQLQLVESRLNDIFTLEQKHQVQTVDELIALKNDYEARLQVLDTSDEQIELMKRQLSDVRRQATDLAQQLTATRQEASLAFARQLVERARLLSLNNLRFEVDIRPTRQLTPTGSDSVEFAMAFNKSQPLMPVKDTASGGEISRVMLCIKAIVAQRVNLPTIILDEVDTGVSGDTASRMGEMMGDIARNIQVIAITHLPQVASHGDNHLKVFKSDDNDRTNTHVTQLDHDQHIMEIARMLSGKDINQAAIDNAKALIEQNRHHE